MDSQKSVVVMAGKELVCVDRFDRLLVGGIQVVQDRTVPGQSQATLRCRVNCRRIAELRMVEGMHLRIQLAHSLNRLDCQGSFLSNASAPLSSPSSCRLARWWGSTTPFKKKMWDRHWTKLGGSGRNPRSPSQTRWGAVPEHVTDLYQGTRGCCESSSECLKLAQLLQEYNDLFSCGDNDMGLTKVVCHEIPLAAGTVPIKQPTRRLGLEKEVSEQVHDLLDRDLIEPAHSVWRSPVVLVNKKNGSWRFCVEYRKLNSAAIQDAYPFRKIDKSLDALA